MIWNQLNPGGRGRSRFMEQPRWLTTKECSAPENTYEFPPEHPGALESKDSNRKDSAESRPYTVRQFPPNTMNSWPVTKNWQKGGFQDGMIVGFLLASF